MPDFTATARDQTLDIRGAMSADDARRIAHEETGAAHWAITVTPADHSRTRAIAAAEWDALPDEPRTIAQHLAHMSPERRAEIERLFA